MASLREIKLITLPDFLVGAGLMIYGLWMQRHVPSVAQTLTFALMMVCGVLIAYGLWMILVTMAFWLVRVENIAELLTAIYETGRFPVTAFGTGIRMALTFVVPIAFLTTFPAAALLGILDPIYLAVAPVMALALIVASRVFWRFALRSYTSASS
jgi:ABC-2 type transport system permease protein